MRRKITALLLALCMACTLTMTACAASASESRGGEAAPLTSGEEGPSPSPTCPVTPGTPRRWPTAGRTA